MAPPPRRRARPARPRGAPRRRPRRAPWAAAWASDRRRHLGARPPRRWPRTAPAWRSAARAAAARRVRRPAAARCAPAGRPAARRSAARSQSASAIARRSPLLAVLATRSRRRSAWSRSAKMSSVSIVSMSASGSTRPSGCTTLGSSWARTTCTSASVSRMLARNWLPRPSPTVRAGDQPGDVVEGDRVGHDLGRLDRRGHLVEALVGHGHDGDVGLDRRERVVGRLGGHAGQRAEQRRLAGVGHPDDADLHGAPPRGPRPCARHDRAEQRAGGTSLG